ncbi:MAG: TolC family protein [Deltaproteobacteria bacterium]|nr:TolC family protein [Deltaproteobacteria bacterium]
MSKFWAGCTALVVALPAAPPVHAEKPGPEVRATVERKRPSMRISLPELLQVAIRQSPALTRAVIDIDVAQADALAASGLDDFTLTAAAALTRARTWQTLGGIGLYGQTTAGVELGVSRGLSTGATVRANVSGHRITETFEPDGMPAAKTFGGVVTNASASLVQPILRGFGRAVARADVRRASFARDVATLQQAAEALNLTRDVIVAYWQVAYAHQVVEIRAEALKLATAQLRVTRTAVRTGSVSPTETLAAEQAIAVREQAFLLAQVAVSELSLELRRRTGLELGKNEIDLSPTTPLQAQTETFDVDVAIDHAIKDNPLLAMIEAKGKGSAVEVELTDDGTRPRLDFHASVGATGRSNDAGEAFRQLGVADTPSYSVGLVYEQQLGARAARGAHDRAKAIRRRVRIDLEEARREVIVSVAHAVDLLRVAQKRIQVSDQAISLARRNLEIGETRFLNGKATNFDVLLRQDEVQQASVSRALAVTDALAAEATVHALTGTLLERHDIRIAPAGATLVPSR